jgi:hypothetical protein
MKYPQEPIGPVCANDKCGKVVYDPFKVVNLRWAESYFACPYCLSKLEITTAEQESSPENSTEEPISLLQTDSEKTKGPGKCPQYFGYLKERPKDTTILSECVTCPEAVNCLLGSELLSIHA